jgi:hypothetical protein
LESNMWICINVLSQAIIASNGKLTPNFQYIQDLRLANRYVIVLPLLNPIHVVTDFQSVWLCIHFIILCILISCKQIDYVYICLLL